MRTVVLMILLMSATLLASSKVHRVRGTWEDCNSIWNFSRDTVTQINKKTFDTVRAKYVLEHKGDQTRMILMVSKYRPDLSCTLTLGVPFALLRYEGDKFQGKLLLMKTVKTEGVLIQDYPLFPWPEFVKPYKVLCPSTATSPYSTR